MRIGALVKLKLAHCACIVRHLSGHNRGYLQIHCFFNAAAVDCPFT
jgi:hypothetical protein